MSQSKKMAGILIENKIKQRRVVSSIIGIGLNVNQEKFEKLPQASSCILAGHKKLNVNDVFESLLEALATVN